MNENNIEVDSIDDVQPAKKKQSLIDKISYYMPDAENSSFYQTLDLIGGILISVYFLWIIYLFATSTIPQ